MLESASGRRGFFRHNFANFAGHSPAPTLVSYAGTGRGTHIHVQFFKRDMRWAVRPFQRRPRHRRNRPFGSAAIHNPQSTSQSQLRHATLLYTALPHTTPHRTKQRRSAAIVAIFPALCPRRLVDRLKLCVDLCTATRYAPPHAVHHHALCTTTRCAPLTISPLAPLCSTGHNHQ